MKPFSVPIRQYVCVGFTIFGLFASAETVDGDSLTSCGTSCLNSTASSFGCDVASIACRCRSDMLDSSMSCLTDSCQMGDIMHVFKAQAKTCALSHESKSSKYMAGAGVLVAIVILSSLVRGGGKFATKRQGMDDILILVCFVLCMAIFFILIVNSTKGLGRHMWDISDTETVVDILRLIFAVKICVPIALTLAKISIVSFYMSIFRSAPSKIAAWTLVGFLVLAGLANTFTGLLECRPVAYFWNKNIDSGICHSSLVTHGVGVTLSVVQDVCIIAFPACHVGRLQMRKKQKVLLIAIFTCGGLGCLAAIIRLVQIIKAPYTNDPTWDYAKLEILAGIELTICYMGACMPMLTACLATFFPKYFGNTSRSLTVEPSKPPGSLSNQLTKNLPSKSPSHTVRRASLQPMELSLMRAGHTDGDWDRIPSPPVTPTRVYRGHGRDSDPERGDYVDKLY